MAKKTTPKSKPVAAKPVAAKKPAKAPARKSATVKSAAAKSAAKPARKSPAKRKSKEPAVLTAKSTQPKSTKAKPTRSRKAAPQASETYLAKVSHWPQDVFAGLGRMIQKAAPAKDAAKNVAAESLGWIKSRATRVKQVGTKELHELVRVASKLKELRSTPAPATGKRKAKHK